MNKLSKIVIALLSAAVVMLGAALFLQSSSPTTAGMSAPDTPNTDGETVDTKGTADLLCSVQSGSLQIIRGESFGVSKGDVTACDICFEDGVYTITTAGTDEPIVVTVPDEVRFQHISLTSSGGNLDVNDLDTEELSVACEQGSLCFSGNVAADANVEHAQGETVLQLGGDPAEFNYELTYEMGHIQLNGQSYAGARGNQTIDHNSEKTLRVHCAMGSVDILFPEAS